MAQAKLQISILSARNLYNSDGFLAGKSDPYVVCEVPGQPDMRFQTQTINNDLNPVWNHVGEIAGFMDGDTLEFQVWDKDTFPKPDQLLGKAQLTAADFYPQGIEGALQLSESKTDATLNIRVIVLETTDPQDPNMVMQGQEGMEYQQQGMEYQQQGMEYQQQVSGPQTLHVNVMNARGLYNADGFLAGKSDPYCICLIPEKKHNKFTTKTINNCLDPDWNHTGLIHGFEAGDSLEFQVWDKDTFPKPDQLLGKVTLSPQDFYENPGGIAGVLRLSGTNGEERGELEVSIMVDAAATVEDAQQAAAHEAAHSQHGSHHGGASATQAPAGHSIVQPGVKRLSAGSQNLEQLSGAKMAKLKVTVFSASGLYNADGFLAGKSDPYVLCHVPENKTQKFKTKVINNSLEPTWNHIGVINAFVVGHTLELIVYDSDTPPKPDQQLGKVVLQSDDFFPYGLEGTIELSESKAIGATISMRIEVQPDTTSTGLTGVRPGVHTGASYQMQYGQQVRPAVYQYQPQQGSVYYQQPQKTGGTVQYVSGGAAQTYTAGQTYTTYSTAQVSGAVAQASFDAIDANHDGVITRSEFTTAMAEPTAVQPIATKVEYSSSTPVTYTAAAQPQVVTYAAQPMPSQQMPAATQEISSGKVSYVTMAPAQAPTSAVTSTVISSPMTTVAPSTTYTAPPTTYTLAPTASTAASYAQPPASPVVQQVATAQQAAFVSTAAPTTVATAQPAPQPMATMAAPTTVTTAQPAPQPMATMAAPTTVTMQQPVTMAQTMAVQRMAEPSVTVSAQPTITSQPPLASYRYSGTATTLTAAAPATTVTAPAAGVTYAAAPVATTAAPTYVVQGSAVASSMVQGSTMASGVVQGGAVASGVMQGARVSVGAPGAVYAAAPTTYAAMPAGAVSSVVSGSAGASVFDRLDKNHDGVISRGEFTAAFR